MEKENEKAAKRALAENEELRQVIAALVEIVEETVPYKDDDLREALDVIRKDYLS